MDSSTHLLLWFTPARRKLISCRALDALSGRPMGTFSRFLAGQAHITLDRSGLSHYYPSLRLLGYRPPSSTSDTPNV